MINSNTTIPLHRSRPLACSLSVSTNIITRCMRYVLHIYITSNQAVISPLSSSCPTVIIPHCLHQTHTVFIILPLSSSYLIVFIRPQSSSYPTVFIRPQSSSDPTVLIWRMSPCSRMSHETRPVNTACKLGCHVRWEQWMQPAGLPTIHLLLESSSLMLSCCNK